MELIQDKPHGRAEAQGNHSMHVPSAYEVLRAPRGALDPAPCVANPLLHPSLDQF